MAMSKSKITQQMGGCISLLALLASATPASAADWSDTSIGYRYGTRFAEPYVTNGINKSIFNLTYVSGYKYGLNYLNLDLLQSDDKDSGSQEAYLVYRHTLDIGKLSGKDFSYGPIRSFGVTAGLDWNTKNDPGYGSKKRMLVLGPTLMLEVPGFLNVSLLLLNESNQPTGMPNRYTYDLHPELNAVWGIPIGTSNFSFEGYLNYIASKGRNEYGGATSPEFHVDAAVMWDVSSTFGVGKNTLRAGLEYEYWRNKFGTPPGVVGSLAKTPMVKVEYHF